MYICTNYSKMKIKIKSLQLTNFKGIRTLSLDFNGDTDIMGANATGKTTIYDAFLWLLFGKDSTGRTDFEIKTLDKDGKTKKDIEHQVEGIFIIDGEEITLKKIYKEKWSRKRGAKQDEFIGNETIFQWNNVPMKKEEYQQRVGTIITEDKFRLLSDTKYFNGLDWKIRRKMLIEFLGGTSVDSVMSPELAKALKGKTTEDLRKQLAATRNKLLNEIDTYPTRIDEVNKNIGDIHEIELVDINDEVEKINKQLAGVKGLSEANEKKVSKLMQEKGALMEKIESIKYDITTSKKHLIRTLAKRLEVLKENRERFEKKIKTCEFDISEASQAIIRFDKKLETLRGMYVQTNEQEFIFNGICPTCGGKLSEEKRSEAEKNFNKQKSNALEELIREAGEIKKNKALYEDAYKSSNELLEEAKQLLRDTETDYEESNQTLKDEEKDVDRLTQQEIEESELIRDLKKQIEEINSKIEKIDKPKGQAELVEQLKILTEQQKKYERLAQENEVTLKNIERVNELEQERLNKLDELSKVESLQFDLQEYNKAVINSIELELRTRFHGVEFKMFDQQVNGGIDETCVVTKDGVPYTDLNTASKIWVSLNIINTFAEHYDVYTPIFIDNRESVTNIPEMKQQTISLIVSPNHKKITLCPTKSNK